MLRSATLIAASVLTLGCSRGDVEPQRTSLPDAAPGAGHVSPVIDVTMSPVMNDDALIALAIQIRLEGDSSGTTRLRLPEVWASERELWRYVHDLEVDGATSVRDDGPAVRLIEAEPNAPLTIRYQIVTAYDHEPNARDGQPFAPIVRPAWFYAFGEALFATPEGRADATVHFAWVDAPPDLTLVSDLQQFGPEGGTLNALRESIVLGGRDTKVYTERVGDAEIRIGVRGEYPFDHAAFASMSKRIIASERAFWDDHGEPFTIVLAPLLAVKGSRSLGGTGRSDGFTILMSQDAPLQDLRHLIAHEYFHTWNATRLGGQADGAAEMDGKWFSEGFTEFYTWRLLLGSGLFTLEDFVQAWNEALTEYATSPVLNASSERLRNEYWSNPDIGRLPYRRGPLLAARWDHALGQATGGTKDLDDVMLAMRDAVRDAGDRMLAPDAATLFLSTYVAQGGPSVDAEVKKFVELGQTLTLPSDVFGDCVTVHSEQRPTFDQGWDREATRVADYVVTGLRDSSPAYKAGLRDGMKLVARVGGTPGNSTVPYVLEVLDGQRPRTVSFLPAGEGAVTVQRLELNAESDDARQACVATLSGTSPS